jgi:hypothetical protein
MPVASVKNGTECVLCRFRHPRPLDAAAARHLNRM